ncbi:MAG: FISUMP domain-containing protein [Bacteroidota bacterium]
MELIFTAEHDGQNVPLESILIENLTQGGDTTLYAPDTVLVLDYITSIYDKETIDENTFSVSQNYPNPFKGKTEVELYLQEMEYIIITVSDLFGRILTQYEKTLNRGKHAFTFYAGTGEYYLLTVTGKQTSQTIKMLNAGSYTTDGGKCKIVYSGNKAISRFKSQQDINGFVYNLGDELKYTAYVYFGEKTISDTPTGNQTYIFQFVSGEPCPGTPTVFYEGEYYATVLIGNQCWLKRNLNVGTMITGNLEMTDNNIIEKYCYGNIPDNCATYGGLYQWDEMMQYTTSQGAQGICPPDWHLPTDEEWKQLEGTVDSQYGYPDPEWDNAFWRGYDAGERLKSGIGWYNYGNGSNLYGFLGLPGGYRNTNGTFFTLTSSGNFWSSSVEGANAWIRALSYEYSGVSRSAYNHTYGYSVRCLRD